MLEYEITARRVDAQGSLVHCKNAKLVIDTDLKGWADALNPTELLLAAVAACILKNMECIAPMIHFDYTGVTVRVHGVHSVHDLHIWALTSNTTTLSAHVVIEDLS